MSSLIVFKHMAFCLQICDIDNDALLNDVEVNQFQQKCFNAPLHPQALEDVKAIVSRHTSDGIVDNAISVKGMYL